MKTIDLKITENSLCERGKHALEAEVIELVRQLPPKTVIYFSGGNCVHYPNWKLFDAIKEQQCFADISVNADSVFFRRLILRDYIVNRQIRYLDILVRREEEYDELQHIRCKDSDTNYVLEYDGVIYSLPRDKKCCDVYIDAVRMNFKFFPSGPEYKFDRFSNLYERLQAATKRQI